LSLIFALLFNRRLFSDVTVSQGSVGYDAHNVRAVGSLKMLCCQFTGESGSENVFEILTVTNFDREEVLKIG